MWFLPLCAAMEKLKGRTQNKRDVYPFQKNQGADWKRERGWAAAGRRMRPVACICCPGFRVFPLCKGFAFSFFFF